MRKSFYFVLAGMAAVTLAQQPIFAQTMPETTEGYFRSGKTDYAKNGGLICSFANPAHFAIYRQVRPAGNTTVTDILTRQ